VSEKFKREVAITTMVEVPHAEPKTITQQGTVPVVQWSMRHLITAGRISFMADQMHAEEQFETLYFHFITRGSYIRIVLYE
jgi:hypothetical protein